MQRLAKAAIVYRTHRHGERTRISNNQQRLPFKVELLLQLPVGSEILAHRVNAFAPDLIVKDKVAQPRMSLEMNPEKIFNLALVPVGRIHFGNDTWNGCCLNGQREQHVDPSRSWEKKRIVQLPMAGVLFGNHAAKLAAPVRKQKSAQRGQRTWLDQGEREHIAMASRHRREHAPEALPDCGGQIAQTSSSVSLNG